MEALRFIRTSLVVCLAASAAPSAFAVPAAPGLHTLQQPDGSTFKARQWGDERVHGFETGDGYSIVYDGAERTWTYAVRGSGGQLVSSGAPVTSAAPSGPRHLRPSARAIAAAPAMLNAQQRQLQRAAATGMPPQHAIPTTGTGQLLTLMVNFSDRTTTNSAADITTLIYGAAGTKSVNDHYLEMSHGAYSLAGTVKGWYKAAKTHDYYGANDATYDQDSHVPELLLEAVAALEAGEPTFNWAPYDQDGDCYVDSVAIVHQGTGEEQGTPATDIWSHSWDLNSALYWGFSTTGEYATHTDCPAGGKIKVNAYIIMPERSGAAISTIGVFSHEYGHALGLPDLYDTDGSSEGVGEWSLMASGSWNRVVTDGDSPAHMDAWSKWALGWLTPTNVTGNLLDESIQAASVAADVYQLGTGTAASGEYFLVENRQQSGFDAGLPGAGLLIWHVDAAVTTNKNECGWGTVACSATVHYKVALEQADASYNLERRNNRGDASDPYTQAKSFAVATSPNSMWYSGAASGALVRDIGPLGSTMTATLSYGNVAPVGIADSYAATLNTALVVAAASGVLHNDTDANGDTLTVGGWTTPSSGTLAVQADGSFTYTPATGFTGTVSFTYAANDGFADSSDTTVTITVSANTAPVAAADNYSTTADSTLTVNAANGVLHNDSDADGDPLTAAVATAPRHGSLSLAANGSFAYKPATGFTGTDTFTYTATDGTTDSAEATVTLVVKASGGGGGGGAFGPLVLLLGLPFALRRRRLT